MIGFSGTDGLMGLGVDIGPLSSSGTPQEYTDESKARIAAQLKGQYITEDGVVVTSGPTATLLAEVAVEEQLKLGKLVLVGTIAVGGGELIPGHPEISVTPAIPMLAIKAISPDDPGLQAAALVMPIYARPQWYHKLGMSQTTGYVVAGVGVLGGLYLLSKVL